MKLISMWAAQRSASQWYSRISRSTSCTTSFSAGRRISTWSWNGLCRACHTRIYQAHDYLQAMEGACLSCPALWSTIGIYQQDSLGIRPPPPETERWIARSGNHPLSLCIGTEDTKHALKGLIVPHHLRWHDLGVQTPFPISILPEESLGIKYPALRRVISSLLSKGGASPIPNPGNTATSTNPCRCCPIATRQAF